MKIVPTATAAAASFVTAGVFGIASASIAAADEAADAGSIHTLGSQATLTNGDVVQGWTVGNLTASSDIIPYPVQGTLWEATATDTAIQGTVTPIVSDLNARSASGQTYRALYQVATPQGVNPSTLMQGEKTTGKVYFDVTGDNPNSVVYINAEDQALATWVQPQSGRAGSATTGTPATAGTPGAEEPPAAPLSGSQGTPAPEGTPEAPAEPVPGGSQGTPEGTPAPAAPEAPTDTQGTPEGTPAPAPAEGQQAPAPAAVTPEPGGSQGTPDGGSPAPGS